MPAATISTGLPGTVQTVALTTAEYAVTINGRQNNTECDAAVLVSGDDDWVYNSSAGGSVNMPVAAGEDLPLQVLFGQPLIIYVKAVGTANLFILTQRARHNAALD